ncbi:MAG TPA: hypothetical protein VK191_11000 [Symbiobacteriaceae bacterium]|nr:hypothetical protein [Symbiobacteriaceae bacterium]
MRLKSVILAGAAGVILVGSGFWLGQVAAETGDPGSAADPLVSKSYVDQQVKALADQTSFQVVNLPKGATLVGESGTEIVMRAGQVAVVASPLGGLLDVTGGRDLPQGIAAEANHLLVVPRADGRGVRANMDSVLMVKGAFTLRTGS